MRDIIKIKQTLRKETDMNQELLEPLKFYKNTGRARHEENARQYLDELIARSGVDIAANHATVKKYRAQEAAAEKIAKRIRLYKTLRVLLIIAALIGGIIVLQFEEDGDLQIQVEAAETDYLFDEIGCGLKVKEMQNTKYELFRSLELYYKVLTGKAKAEDIYKEES